MMSPVIFYTIVLGVVEVLQYFLVPLVLKNGTGEPGNSTLFFNLYLYKNFFTYQNMSYGATLAWLLFAITLALTLILFATARRWVYYAGERDDRRPSVRGGIVGRLWPSPADARAAVRRASAAMSRTPFLLTFIAIITVAAFLSPLLRSFTYALKSSDQITQAGTPFYPADPVTFPYQGKDLPLLVVPLPDGSTRTLALFEPGRRRARSSTRTSPDAAPIEWAGSWRTLASLDHRAALGELREGLGPHRLPAPAVQHRGDRGDLDDRDAALVHARRVRVRAFPVPRPEPAVHVADRHGLPARRRDDHPDVPGLPQDRLGRHVAPAPRAHVLCQRLRRVPDAPVLHDDPDRARRGRGHRRRGAVADALVGGASAGLAGGHRGRDLPSRLLHGTTSSGR